MCFCNGYPFCTFKPYIIQLKCISHEHVTMLMYVLDRMLTEDIRVELGESWLLTCITLELLIFCNVCHMRGSRKFSQGGSKFPEGV